MSSRGGIKAEEMENIVQRIVAAAQPVRIILFGSHATGSAGEDSDIDLLILTRDESNARSVREEIRRALFGTGHAYDLILLPESQFERQKNTRGTIAWPAEHEGVVIYGE